MGKPLIQYKVIIIQYSAGRKLTPLSVYVWSSQESTNSGVLKNSWRGTQAYFGLFNPSPSSQRRVLLSVRLSRFRQRAR